MIPYKMILIVLNQFGIPFIYQPCKTVYWATTDLMTSSYRGKHRSNPSTWVHQTLSGTITSPHFGDRANILIAVQCTCEYVRAARCRFFWGGIQCYPVFPYLEAKPFDISIKSQNHMVVSKVMGVYPQSSSIFGWDIFPNKTIQQQRGTPMTSWKPMAQNSG